MRRMTFLIFLQTYYNQIFCWLIVSRASFLSLFQESRPKLSFWHFFKSKSNAFIEKWKKNHTFFLVNEWDYKFPVFTIQIDIPNMSASGEVRFENSLNSLLEFTAKKLPYDPSLPWNGIYFIKNEKKRSGHCSGN